MVPEDKYRQFTNHFYTEQMPAIYTASVLILHIKNIKMTSMYNNNPNTSEHTIRSRFQGVFHWAICSQMSGICQGPLSTTNYACT